MQPQITDFIEKGKDTGFIAVLSTGRHKYAASSGGCQVLT